MRYRLFSLGTDLGQQVNLLELIGHSLSLEQYELGLKSTQTVLVQCIHCQMTSLVFAGL